MTKKILIGRDPSCDYVIFDPQNRVSRNHVELTLKENKIFVRDLNSTNGVYINNNKISPNTNISLTPKDKLTLSVDYLVDLTHFIQGDDNTKVLIHNQSNEKKIVMEDGKGIYNDGQKTILFDTNKTQIGDMVQMDNSPFTRIGRNSDNQIVINNSNISRYHCKIRMLTPVIIEIEDTGSTNGTFADDERITPGKRFQYSTSVAIRLGKSFQLDLRKIFKNIQILQRQSVIKTPSPVLGKEITVSEKEKFMELEELWKEYIGRQNHSNNISMSYSIGGSILALAFGGITGGAGLALISVGGGIIGKYLGNQASSKIRNDLTYEDAFLQTYACPRCSESFQKRPWITIRECYKCKIKFR